MFRLTRQKNNVYTASNMEPEPQIHQEGQFQPRTGVSFPGKPEPKKKNIWAKVVVLAVLLLLIGGIAWFLLSNDNPFSGSTAAPSPTVFVNEFPTEIPTPTIATVSKAELQMQVLNGTGVPGEASFLQKEMEKLGFANIDAANADTKTATKTEVSFSSKVDDTIKTEVASKLQELYTSVDVSDTATAGVDIKIVTGPRKGQSSSTAKTPTPTVRAIITATPTTKVSGTVTVTPKPTTAGTTGTTTPTP